MRMQNALDIRPRSVDAFMDRKLARRLVGANDRSVRFYLYNVCTRQRAFIDRTGRDPYIAVLVKYRQVSA